MAGTIPVQSRPERRPRIAPKAPSAQPRGRDRSSSFEHAFDHAFVGMALLAPDGRWLHVNEALCQILGYSATELRATLYPQLMLPEDRNADATLFGDLCAARSPGYQIERQLMTSTGEARWFRISVAALAGENDATAGAVAQIEDVERRRVEDASAFTSMGELRRSNTELEVFASVAAHDLQEPLRKIRTFGDRLLYQFAEPLEPDGADYLRRMQAAAERMQRLIDDLLIYARVSMRGQPFVPVDLGEVVDEVAIDLEALIEQSGGRFEHGDLPTVLADPSQMRQLFQNLLGNALKFAAPGRAPVVTIQAISATSPAPETIEFEIRDNGIGFDTRYAERIFEPFERLHGRSEYDGTGIGLAICHRIIERHLGAISADSIEGEGSRFLIALPSAQEPTS